MLAFRGYDGGSILEIPLPVIDLVDDFFRKFLQSINNEGYEPVKSQLNLSSFIHILMKI